MAIMYIVLCVIFSQVEGNDGNNALTRKCYITVTAVPSLDNCSACYQVATSYEEEGKNFTIFWI